MSEVAVQGGRAGWRAVLGTAAAGAGESAARPGLDARRALQLSLAGLWLLDGVLQYQPFMYTKAFAQMLAGTADGNPAVIAKPITWQAGLVEHHLVLLNTIFATIQVLLGLGIAIRPTARLALAASIAWSLGVWWFGEGLGGVLNGGASPLNGAPGAVTLYALLAVLLWPADRAAPAPFPAARAVGGHVARALWLVLWLSLASFALTPANRAPQAVSGMIGGMADGEPGWLSAIERNASSLVAGSDLAAMIVLAVALVVIAIGVYLPGSAARAALLLAIVATLVIWVFGQALGAILTGGATDPNSGPLLALLALAYWPARTAAKEAGRMTPAWLLDLLASIMLAGAAANVARLIAVPRTTGRRRPGQVAADVDVAHILMAIAMAGMLAPSLATLPNAAWAAIFGVLTAWFAGRAWVEARHGGLGGLLSGRSMLHLVHCAAMLYVFLAVGSSTAGGGMGGMSMGGPTAMQVLAYPTVAGAFVLLLIGCSTWDLDQLSGRRYSLASAGGPAAGAAAPGRNAVARALVAAPATRVGWEVVLGITMAFMLVIMI